MKLALNGLGHYADFDAGYELYSKRTRIGNPVEQTMYNRVVKAYCRILADRLENEGIVDLPCGLGSISTAIITRKLQYRGDKMIGYGAMDWNKGERDGKLRTFGMVYMSRRDHNNNLRCFGFVANRQLFKRLKEKFTKGESNWTPIKFKEEMI